MYVCGVQTEARASGRGVLWNASHVINATGSQTRGRMGLTSACAHSCLSWETHTAAHTRYALPLFRSTCTPSARGPWSVGPVRWGPVVGPGRWGPVGGARSVGPGRWGPVGGARSVGPGRWGPVGGAWSVGPGRWDLHGWCVSPLGQGEEAAGVGFAGEAALITDSLPSELPAS